MNSEIRKELESLRTMAVRLLNKIDSIATDPDQVIEPDATREKLANRVCLGCGITVPSGDWYKRGLHNACYHTTMRRIRDGDWSEKERIEAGKLAKEGGKPGRPAAIDAAAAAEIIAKEIADKIAPPKVAEPKDKYKKRKGD